ncbi:MAG: PqqD family protein [Elusimicrobia bacterium]|nr:PqqD family protein [Elusimicrobiota bacterium]
MAGEKKNTLIAEAVAWRKAGDEAVILNLETSEYYSANETGTFIWELLSAGRKPAGIAEALAAEYSIERGQADRDVSAYLRDLAKLKILGPEAGK